MHKTLGMETLHLLFAFKPYAAKAQSRHFLIFQNFFAQTLIMLKYVPIFPMQIRHSFVKRSDST